MQNKIIIGIDQSYQDTGVSIAYDGAIKSVASIKLKKCSDNTERREMLRNRLYNIFRKALELSIKYNCKVECIIERIRLHSSKGSGQFLNIDYIKAIGALNAVIVDTATLFSIPVYSVDTRSWKSNIVGTSKPATKNVPGCIQPEKWPTINFCLQTGLKKYIVEPAGKRKKYLVDELTGERVVYNDNKADAICISLYGFLPEKEKKLEVEK